MYRLAFFTLILAAVFMQHSCSKDNVSEDTFSADCTETISFQADIQQMIQQSCATAGCHNEGAGA